MSNDNKKGRIDRRKKTPRAEIYSNIGFERVYAGTAIPEKEKLAIETAAFKTAYAKTEDSDKANLAGCKEVLIEQIGKSFGDISAYQLLARLGVFLLEAEREGVW